MARGGIPATVDGVLNCPWLTALTPGVGRFDITLLLPRVLLGLLVNLGHIPIQTAHRDDNQWRCSRTESLVRG
jgi:hypothetical protein